MPKTECSNVPIKNPVSVPLKKCWEVNIFCIKKNMTHICTMYLEHVIIMYNVHDLGLKICVNQVPRKHCQSVPVKKPR